MEKMPFKVSQLIAKLTANRAQHLTDYQEAEQGYRESVRIELGKKIVEIDSVDKKIEDFDLYVALPKPENHVEDYDTVLEMLDLTTADTLELSQEEFRQFVKDDWKWKRAFLASSNMYKNSR